MYALFLINRFYVKIIYVAKLRKYSKNNPNYRFEYKITKIAETCKNQHN